MKQECPTYLKTIGKSKALAATLSDTKPEDDSDNEDDGILNAFTVIMNPTEGIDEEVDDEKDLVESKFEKMDNQDDIHTTYKKNYTRFLRSMRNYISWPPRSSVMWSLNVKKSLRSLMKPIKLLEHCGLRTISWLRKPRSLRQSGSKSELSWRGLQVLSLTRCLAFRNLLLIESV